MASGWWIASPKFADWLNSPTMIGTTAAVSCAILPDCEECYHCEDAQHPQALRTISAGGPFDENYAHAYVSALELICGDLGTDIGDASFWFGYDGLPDVILSLVNNMDGEDSFPSTGKRLGRYRQGDLRGTADRVGEHCCGTR